MLSLANIYHGDVILSGVTALGQDLGGRTRSEASQMIKSEWQNRKVILDGGEQSWTLSPEQLGVMLDADAMAEAAYQQGRAEPNLNAIVPTVRRIVASSGLGPGRTRTRRRSTPVWRFDRATATKTIRTLAGQIDIPVQNAGVTVVDGQVQTTPAQAGRALDVGGTAHDPRIAPVGGRAGPDAEPAAALHHADRRPAPADHRRFVRS